MATFDDYMATPDPGKMSEFVRGAIVQRRGGGLTHGTVVPALIGAWSRYAAGQLSMDKTSTDDAARQRHQREDELQVGAGFVNLGLRFALPDDPDQVRCVSLALFTAPQMVRLRPFVQAHPDAFAPEPPALALDIVLPGDTADYAQRKALDLLAAGIPLLWLAYPLSKSVTVITATGAAQLCAGNDSLDASAVFPGFTITLATLFD